MPATIRRGPINTATDTTNAKLDISEVIDFLSPYEVPLLDRVGRDSLHAPATQIRHSWMEDELKGRSGTLAAQHTSGSGTFTLTTDQGKYLVPDDLIRVSGGVFRVVSGAPDSDTIGVTLVGGTDSTVASGTAWKRVAHAAQQGGSARSDSSKTVMVEKYNYPQIFKDWVVVTGTMEVIDRYGYVSERAYQEEKVMRSLAIDCEQALLYGVRSIDNGPPVRYTMGGMWDFIYSPGVAGGWSTVHNAAGAALTEDMFVDMLESIWTAGGQVDTVLVGSYNKRVINTWATPRIRTERSERTAGAFVTTYESDFGNVEIMLHRWLDASDAVFTTMEELGIGPLVNRQWSSRELPSSLDGSWFEVLGEYTQEVHKPSINHGWIYNLATS
jgi:hypothetical protein